MPVYNQSRSRVIQLIFIVVIIVIIAQLLHLQLFSDELKIQADNNAIFRKVVYPDRGIIYDRNGKAILENTIMYDLLVTPSQVRGTDTMALCTALSIDTAEFRKRILNSAFKNGYYKPGVFEALVKPDVYARLSENMYKLKGFDLVERPVRTYPYHAAGHVLGYVGEIDTSYLRRHKDEGYEMGDYAGLTGLEAKYEKILMGQRGVKRYIKDNLNRIQGPYESGHYDTAAIAGRNLYTSMDIELQQLAEKLLQNKIGSAVAINPQTGGILAMVSSPDYDPNLLTGPDRRKNFSALFLDTAKPLLNRAIKGQYPPGSTFKPMGALIALDEGLITPAFGYPCGGAYYACGRPVKCEHHDAGHAASLRLALSHSCNSYFSQVFRMAIDNPAYSSPQEGYLKWKEYMNAFGMGVRLDVDLPSEDKGNIPDTSRYDKDFGSTHWNSCNILTLGIGQDRMLATPLQLANVMCFIANKGYYYLPHFVDSVENEMPSDSVFLGKYRRKHQVTHISSEDFDAVQLAMLDVTVSGTAVGARVDGIDICAKTGTAQNPHGKNHSLFVAFAPKDHPKIAIAVVVENAGFGATWAAPIASLMIEKYINDTISAKRLPEVDRISNADLIPSAIKHWYQVRDSIKMAKLAKQIDADKAPVFENTNDNRKTTFDPEAEPDRRDPDPADTAKQNKLNNPAIKPNDQKNPKPNKN